MSTPGQPGQPPDFDKHQNAGQPPPGYGPPPGYDQPGYGPPPPGYDQPGYGPPPGYPPHLFGDPVGPGGVDPSAPYGRHPFTGEPYSDKQKLLAGLLQLLLGGVGAGRWYLGDTGIALAQLFTCGGLGVWSLIDGIMMLTGNVRDKYGRPLRD